MNSPTPTVEEVKQVISNAKPSEIVEIAKAIADKVEKGEKNSSK